MPLVWISISFTAGLSSPACVLLPANIWLSLGLFFIFLFILLRLPEVSKIPTFNPFPLPIIISSSCLPSSFLGAWWYQFRQPNIDAFHIAFYNDRDYEILVTGTLTEPPDQRDTYTNLKLNVEAVDSGSGDMPASGIASCPHLGACGL